MIRTAEAETNLPEPAAEAGLFPDFWTAFHMFGRVAKGQFYSNRKNRNSKMIWDEVCRGWEDIWNQMSVGDLKLALRAIESKIDFAKYNALNSTKSLSMDEINNLRALEPQVNKVAVLRHYLKNREDREKVGAIRAALHQKRQRQRLSQKEKVEANAKNNAPAAKMLVTRESNPFGMMDWNAEGLPFATVSESSHDGSVVAESKFSGGSTEWRVRVGVTSSRSGWGTRRV